MFKYQYEHLAPPFKWSRLYEILWLKSGYMLDLIHTMTILNLKATFTFYSYILHTFNMAES